LQIYFVLTVDYEVFGDGSGCIENCVIKPAEKIMGIAEEFNIPITFFVDVLEFIVMENCLETKKDVLKVKKQLRNAILKGHDVQLHLHPQWKGAYWEEGKGWHVNMAKWRVGDLPYEEILKLLKQGKSWLENLLKPVRSDYKCVAFRAGDWCIQPSANVIRALKKIKIQIDSTVAPGIKNYSPDEWSDFSYAPKLPYWKINNDVCEPSKDGIWEVPITTASIGIIKHFKILFNHFFIQKQKFASGCSGSYKGPGGLLGNIKGKLMKLTKLGKVMLDLCTIPERMLRFVILQWIEKVNNRCNKILPIVAIAHTKNFTCYSEESLCNFLKWLKMNNIKPITFPHLVEVFED